MRRGKRLNVPRDDGRRSLAKKYVMDGLSRFTTGQYSENLPVGCMLGYVLDGDVKYVASSVQAKIIEDKSGSRGSKRRYRWSSSRRAWLRAIQS